MNCKLTHEDIHIATREEILEGRLVFVDGALVAVVSRLTETYGEQAGEWFVEASFGPVEPKEIGGPFARFEEVLAWVRHFYR